MSRILTPALRRALSVGLAGLTLATVVPAADAQQGGAEQLRTHTVRRGDTLWDLARQYLGDPFQWPQIYRLNTDVVEDPNRIYPGEILRIPGPGTAVAAEPATPAGGGDADRLIPPLPADTAMAPFDTGAVARGNDAPTVFASSMRRQSGGGTRQAGRMMLPRPAYRAGEVAAAPFLTTTDGVPGSGELIGTAEVQSLPRAEVIRDRRIQFREQVSVRPPSGTTLREGDLLLVYRMADSYGAGRRIAVPTGMLRVKATPAGKVPVAEVIREYEGIIAGQSVVPFERVPTDTTRPVPVSNGPTTSVLGVQNDRLAPTMQDFVFFPVTAADGVRMGDQITVYRPAEVVAGRSVPETDIATVTVVRVTPQGTTGMVVSQRSSRIEAGAAARLTARMP